MAVGISRRTIHFAQFTVDLRLKELRRDGVRLKLSGQPFAVLAKLLENPGEVVTREELHACLWQKETFVDFDHSLNVAINKLRETLCDSVEKPRFVETVPRTGYRFIALVEVTPPMSGETLGHMTAGAVAVESAMPVDTSRAGPASTAASRQRLYWSLAALAVVLLCSVGVYVAHRGSRHASAATPPKIMLAVLPFENLTGDPANEYFSDGLTEEMITRLAELQPDRLGVIARTSIMSYKHSDRSIAHVAGQLGVQYILEGSLRQTEPPSETTASAERKSTGRVRITAQLIQVKDQTHVWAQDYDREMGDVLTMERDVSSNVAREIQLQLTPRQRTDLARLSTTDPEAHELYLKGRFYWNKRTTDGYEKSVEYFSAAIRKDPNYAEAYAGLADAYRFLMTDLPPEEVLPKARAAAEKALALNPNLAEAHASLGLIAPYYNWDWQAARRHLQRAIELNPNSVIAHDWYADGYLSEMGDLDGALAELHVAQRLDPLSLVVLDDIGKNLYFARRYDEAIAQLRIVLDMDPSFSPADDWLWQAYIAKGMYSQALGVVEAEKEYVPERFRVSDLAYIYARMGEKEQARKLLAQLLKFGEHEHIDPGNTGVIYLALGDNEQAFAWFEKAYQVRSNSLSSLKVWPAYDPVRNDPRFIDLERRVKLIP